jgi:hypothetical protein
MKPISRASFLALLLTAPLAVTASAQNWAHGNGNVVSTNWNRMEMDIKDPGGQVRTWQVARDCEVKFEDKKSDFPSPSYKDLRRPMYIAFLYEAGSTLIQSVTVREVGYEPSQGGPGTPQDALVTNLDMNVGHIEVTLSPGGRKTFEVDPKGLLSGIQKGDTVTLLLERRDGREVVTKITKKSGATPAPDQSLRRRRP